MQPTSSCGQAIRQGVCQKDGPNKNRIYFSCECGDGFKWLDDWLSDKEPILCKMNWNINQTNCERNNVRRFRCKKEGPNKGRFFYSCECGEGFKWEDESNPGDILQCRKPYRCRTCSHDIPLLTVQKEGPNKGKQFLSCRNCPKSFEWLSDDMSLYVMNNLQQSQQSQEPIWRQTPDDIEGFTYEEIKPFTRGEIQTKFI